MKTPYLFRPENKAADREYIFRKASARTGLPAYIIEKDYIVCIALSLIFDDIKPQCTEKTDTPFLFKGGTSLSKVYNVINRMSEDIDLSLSMDYLGCPEPEDESNSARKRRIKKLTEHGSECISTIIKTCFEKQLSLFHKDFDVLVDPAESQNLIVNYPRSLNDSDYHNSYIKPHILIETGGRAAFDPHSSHKISPMALDEISTLLQIDEDCCCIVDVLDIERTFFEKLTLLHELNNRGVDALSNRQTRHIYDLVQIYRSNREIVFNRTLLEEVRNHKEKYFQRGSAHWEHAVPGTLSLIPSQEFKGVLCDDWDKMTDMFPGNSLPFSFEKMMSILKEIDHLINYEEK